MFLKRVTLVLTLLLTIFAVSANAQKGNKLQLLPWHGYFFVNAVKTNDCCIDLEIFNTQCNFDGRTVTYYQYDGNGNIIGTAQVPFPPGSMSQTIRLCAQDGENYIHFKIHEVKNGTPADSFSIIGTVPNLTGCCPCPENRADFLNISLVKDYYCPNACKVMLSLNLPDSLSCYTHYQFEQTYPGLMSGVRGINEPISVFDYCLSAGHSTTIKVYLLKDQYAMLDTSCVIEKTVYCDTDSLVEIPDDTTLLVPCSPDCPPDGWANTKTEQFWIPSCNFGCLITVKYTHRIACLQNYQDLQLLRIEYSPECLQSCTIDNIYQKALLGVIAKNRMDFIPKIDSIGCDTTWRVSNGGCWAEWEGYIILGNQVIDTTIVMGPCDSVQCCYQPITVCRDNNNVVTTFNNNQYPQQFDCTGKFYTTGGFFPLQIPCDEACNWMQNMNGKTSDGIMPKIAINQHSYENTPTYAIRDYFANDIINIYIQSEKRDRKSVV